MERCGERNRRTQSDRRVAKEWERGGGGQMARERVWRVGPEVCRRMSE